MSTDGSRTSSNTDGAFPRARDHLDALGRRLARALDVAPAALGAFAEGQMPALRDAHAALFALANHARRAHAQSVDATLTTTALRVAVALGDGVTVPAASPRTAALVERAFGVPLALETAQYVSIPPPDGDAVSSVAVPGLALAWLARLRSLETEALADVDPEGVHQLRVASRRLREVLRALGRTTDDAAAVARLVATVKSVARAGGMVRDLDVARELVAARIPAGPVLDAALAHLAVVRARRLVRMRAALTGPAHEARLARARVSLEQLAAQGGTSDRATSDVLRAVTDRELSKLRAQLTGDMTAEGAYHAVRRRARRVRDAVELYGTALRKGQRAWRKRLHAVQALLGGLNDVEVTTGLLAGSSPSLLAARERLSARRLELLAELATPLALLAVALRFDEGD